MLTQILGDPATVRWGHTDYYAAARWTAPASSTVFKQRLTQNPLIHVETLPTASLAVAAAPAGVALVAVADSDSDSNSDEEEETEVEEQEGEDDAKNEEYQGHQEDVERDEHGT